MLCIAIDKCMPRHVSRLQFNEDTYTQSVAMTCIVLNHKPERADIFNMTGLRSLYRRLGGNSGVPQALPSESPPSRSKSTSNCLGAESIPEKGCHNALLLNGVGCAQDCASMLYKSWQQCQDAQMTYLATGRNSLTRLLHSEWED